MALPNHNEDNIDYSVYQMTRQRLPFITDTPDNQKLISGLTLQIMYELEGCFKVSKLPDGTEDKTRIGDENYYSVIMRSIIADLVTIYLLMILGAGIDWSTGEPVGTTPDIATTTYLKKAKAGSAEVEYDQYDMKKSTANTLLGTQGLITGYKASAIRKAHTLGCLIDLNEDGSVELFLDNTVPVPFIHIGGCGCC